ncbi:TolC family protein, partial [Kaarinaea lacus]
MNLISETYLTKVLIFSASITLLAQSSFLFAQPVNVSEEKGFRPTLREAIDAAYQRHQQQLILKANARQVSAQQDRSRSLLPGPPSLDISVKSDQVGSDEGYREYEAGIELPLWRIGQRGTEQQLASISQSLLLQSEASLRLIVAGKVRELMWNASLLKNDEILAEKEKQTAETLEQNVSRRVELGELARTDLLLAQTHTLHKKSALVQAEADLRTALNDYHLITGYTQLPRQRFEQRSEAESLPL